MTHSISTDLHRMLIEAVANDFEQFAAIITQISRWSDEPQTGDGGFLREALMHIVDMGEIDAYELSAVKPPYKLERPLSNEDINYLWFYASPKGFAYLRQLEATDK